MGYVAGDADTNWNRIGGAARGGALEVVLGLSITRSAPAVAIQATTISNADAPASRRYAAQDRSAPHAVLRSIR